ncbi:MAG: S9 family peptidase, partial [Anaerolineales bacterium]
SLNVNGDESGGQVLAAGNDFYSSPRLSPDGNRLAWLTWNHPNMPWDGTELWAADLRKDGSVANAECVAGGLTESIFQPEWSPDGVLYFISDRTGWWNLYCLQGGQAVALCPMQAEFGEPQWVFGMSTYGFESAGRIICAYIQNGASNLASLDTQTLKLEQLETPYTEIGQVRAAPGKVVFVGGSPALPGAIAQLDLVTRKLEVLRQSRAVTIDPGYFSRPQPIEFPTEGGLTAHGFFYPPRNRDYVGLPDEKPPLLVMSHGGPTGSASITFRYGIQFWTSRGIAVLDVDYGGSTGYGRAYRERLKGNWGIVDVDDCVNGARYLVERGKVDGNRLAITGGSAGGYTTLATLTFRDAFKAGASHYGISDLEALAKETHKFESHYLDTLIGPYPERRDLYVARSPIHFVHQLDAALILLQGSEDKVVPPNQAEMMFEAARAKE